MRYWDWKFTKSGKSRLSQIHAENAGSRSSI
jgi:hypothetical protein